MSAPASDLFPASKLNPSGRPSSQEVVRKQKSHELVFGVVGHIGSGASLVAEELAKVLQKLRYDPCILKASDIIRAWAEANAKLVPPKGKNQSKTFDYVSALQDFGDEMRSETNDYAAVARRLVSKIRQQRATALHQDVEAGKAVEPDEQKRAYILDSIRHPVEVELLRHLYRSAFVLIGVVCDEETRVKRITKKLSDVGDDRARDLMSRDAKAKVKWGQRVSDAFHLADIFLDNSAPRTKSSSSGQEPESNPDWNISEQLERLIKLITREKILRATPHEAAMYIAYGAQMKSACLSRQVGAALTNKDGNTVATGTNDVPRAGGGLYGEIPNDSKASEPPDHRCAFRSEKYCSNSKEQGDIIRELSGLIKPHIEEFSNEHQRLLMEKLREATKGQLALTLPPSFHTALQTLLIKTIEALQEDLRSSRVGGLLEFSRAVHAEMDAVLAAARSGASIVGGRLYVTTFPCHYCARHLVAAGIDEVQYIEPYPKSKALELHADAITASISGWTPPSEGGLKVLIRPFTGIAPRLYERVFLKVGELKDDKTGEMRIGDLPWGDRWNVQRISYAELEAKLTRDMEEQQGSKGQP